MDVISVQSLSKSFGSIQAVNELSFSVSQGEIFGLVGPDGAGKTTTMRMLTGIMLPDSGTIKVLGKEVGLHSKSVKDEIGYMSQRFGLYPDLTVMENLRFFADLYGVSRKERESATERLLTFSRLSPFKDRPAGKLSGGMKQKLGLMCALIHTPKVLFLDEPTFGVDPVSRYDFWQILYQLLKEQVTIFVSTAYLDEAERCGRVGFMHKGSLLTSDSPANLKKRMMEKILELELKENRRAAAFLQKEFGSRSVSVYGGRIHLAVKDYEKNSETALKLLHAQNIKVDAVRQVVPSLEDVFVYTLLSVEN
jgi:ABC-2 type transport system ATP-binding protein